MQAASACHDPTRPAGTNLCYGDNTMIQYYDGAGLLRVGR
jgi:hypothetical protein